MLTELTIRNFALIEDLAVAFGAGMTVLSGETGAGKSILVGALNLILGDRADADAVREGAARADISARFSLADAPAARRWLADHALESEDNECVIRRVIERASDTRTSRSRCWINGAAMPVRELRGLGENLVNIHGQHAHRSLLASDAQRAILDEYGGHGAALAAVADAAAALRATRAAIGRIEGNGNNGETRIELLRYQVNELAGLDLGAGEPDLLEAEHQRLAAAERLIADAGQALAALYEAEDSAAYDQLGAAERLLGDLAGIDPGFHGPNELVTSARIATQEAADSLRRHVETLEVDPERLAAVEARLAAIQDLARKHRCAPSELPAVAQRLERELAELEGAGQRLDQLKREETQQRERYARAAAALSQQRQDSARGLSQAVTEIIQTLGMPEGCLQVGVTADAHPRVAATGTDTVAFAIAANPGQGARALARVASGGELSRISLAIEVVAASRTRVPTLVFDEVDTGIGGRVAEIVGRQLRALGDSGQSLCVTHLPQIAALAQHHLVVAKRVDDGQTVTRIAALDADDRAEEIARMLGGVQLSAQTRAHAADMLARAQID